MFFFENPLVTLRRQADRDRMWRDHVDRNQDKAIAWSEQFKVGDEVMFKHDTWQPFRLFDVESHGRETPPTDDADKARKHVVFEPKRRLWCYDERLLPRATAQNLCTGSVNGHWICDGPIVVPRMFEFTERDMNWRMWMSYTPQEVASQRPGLRKAHGHTLVAGLGMGWLLTRVLQKKSVKRVTLVECSQHLVDWLVPVLKTRHWSAEQWQKLEIVVGDAYEIVPKAQADVALWDIFESLGRVSAWDEERMHKKCPGIGETWFWGAHARLK